ncbi:MAG: hypothetical protein NVS1B16_10670 [Pseudarthrobacter sp.]
MIHMVSSLNLTPTSYVVLGLVASRGPSTPYELKSLVAKGIGYFWSFPHAQLYSEPPRLADAGLLAEDREADGRRRRRFSITPLGFKELRRWLADPTGERTEMRDPGLLKLFFAESGQPGDVMALAEGQEHLHRERLARYQQLVACLADEPTHPHARATIQMGLRFEEVAVAFWQDVRESRLEP